MGCCSSKKSNVTNSVSPAKAPEPNNEKNPNADITMSERVNPDQLQQHHDINQQTDEDDEDISPPHSFANNRSIYREMMRLEECELNDHQINDRQHIMEIKSNENSEDAQIGDNDQSFAEFNDPKSPSNNQKHGGSIPYHPFGLIQTDKTENVKKPKKEEDPEALYAENLKQHGFDPEKFRMANSSIHKSQLDNGQSNGSDDVISSFVSSQLSSTSEIVSKRKERKKEKYQNIDIDAFLAEDQDDDDLLLQELSRPNSKRYDSVNMREEDDEPSSYIEGIKESVRGMQMDSIMNLDDEDENLMDAILSLDLED